jgi:hypothetical protein
MKRKESERSQLFRRRSYASVKAREDSEPWQSLRVHNISSVESAQRLEDLYYHK